MKKQKYTPEMSEIKQYYIDTVQRAYQTENGKSCSIDRIEQEFDRWLKEVKREAWKKGAIWHDRKKFTLTEVLPTLTVDTRGTLTLTDTKSRR